MSRRFGRRDSFRIYLEIFSIYHHIMFSTANIKMMLAQNVTSSLTLDIVFF